MAKKDKFTTEDDDLLSALGVEVEVKKKATFTAQEERIIAGFEEIQKFVEVGFKHLSLGSRIHRVETVVPLLVGKLFY